MKRLISFIKSKFQKPVTLNDLAHVRFNQIDPYSPVGIVMHEAQAEVLRAERTGEAIELPCHCNICSEKQGE